MSGSRNLFRITKAVRIHQVNKTYKKVLYFIIYWFRFNSFFKRVEIRMLPIVRPSRFARERQRDSDWKLGAYAKRSNCFAARSFLPHIVYHLRVCTLSITISFSWSVWVCVFFWFFFHFFQMSELETVFIHTAQANAKCVSFLWIFGLSFFYAFSTKIISWPPNNKKKKIHRNVYQVGALMQMCAIHRCILFRLPSDDYLSSVRRFHICIERRQRNFHGGRTSSER